MTEKELLEILNSFSKMHERISELEEKIMSKSYRVTSVFGETSGGGGFSSYNKTEAYVFDKMALEEELERYKKNMDSVSSLLKSDKLTEEEHNLLEWITLGGELTKYADNNGIYRSNVYKKRDRLLKKAVKIIHNDSKNG